MHGDGDHRTIRDRQAAFDDALDRLAGSPRIIAARRLVQIYDNGSMPADADHFFAAHPVEMDGDESEGTSGAVNVDSGTTLYVDVIRGVPSAGDNLVATLVGGRWVAELGASNFTFMCYWCCAGATVTIADCGASDQAMASATTQRGKVTAVTLAYAGSGCTPPPAVTIAAPPGPGATATAKAVVKQDGTLASIKVVNHGSGYDPAHPPAVTVAAPPPVGTTATATAVMAGDIVGSITLVNHGTHYVPPPVVVISPPPMGVTATAIAAVGPTGSVESLTLTNGGSGYINNVPPPSNLSATVTCDAGTFGPMTLALTGYNSDGFFCYYYWQGTMTFGGVPLCIVVITSVAGVCNISLSCGVSDTPFHCDFDDGGGGTYPFDGFDPGSTPPMNGLCQQISGSGNNALVLSLNGPCTGRPYADSLGPLHFGDGLASIDACETLWKFLGGTCGSPHGLFGYGPTVSVTVSEV
jgi:hypothetical protein